MPRWKHGSKERLKLAAMDLFEEQGFQNTSAVQIAKRARLTTRTFFRYFPDKQAILFDDADALCATLVGEVLRMTDQSGPLLAVTRALTAFDWLSLAPRESQRRRYEMIASNPDLLERELIKQQQMVDGFTSALRAGGVDPPTADLAARVGVQVFQSAYRQWLATDQDADLAMAVETAMSNLSAIVAGSPSTSPI